MSHVDWYIEGVEVSNCNCDYACPCQFESRRPTHGECRGFAAVRIEKGHFGDVPLNGLCAALLYGWPGPIYEGNGECQAVIDEQADRRQRDALAAIMYGKETNEGQLTGGCIRPCRAPSIPRSSRASSLTRTSKVERRAS
ncbi:MAG: DUF1326 domain-containing protein [Vicinamibacterales bacterium]